MLCEVLTDNRNRTAGDLRKAFEVCGGNLGSNGCVSYLFEYKGLFVIEAKHVAEDQLMEVVLEAGADDLKRVDDYFEVTCDPKAFESVRKALEEHKIATESADTSYLPANYVRPRRRQRQADAPAPRPPRRERGRPEHLRQRRGPRGAGPGLSRLPTDDTAELASLAWTSSGPCGWPRSATATRSARGAASPTSSTRSAVALILDRAGFDEEVVIAGLLHDLVEDTEVTLDQIRGQFGDRVAATGARLLRGEARRPGAEAALDRPQAGPHRRARRRARRRPGGRSWPTSSTTCSASASTSPRAGRSGPPSTPTASRSSGITEAMIDACRSDDPRLAAPGRRVPGACWPRSRPRRG